MAYTNIDDPSAYFQTTLYTGTGAAHSIGNDGNSDLKPDWVWIKKRSASGNHSVFDSTRGVYKELVTNGTNAEASDVQLLTQFDTDGFTVGTNSGVNGSGATFVGWQWKANGGTTSSNTDGTLTGGATVQANTDAGFSIITYTGTSQTNPTVGHGLNQAPELVIVKNRDLARNWAVGSTAVGWTKYLDLDTADAAVTNSGWWGNQDPTSTTVGLGTASQTAGNTYDYVMYAFHSVQGYSKFGSYVGNGNTNGAFIYTGFKPAFVMIKRSDGVTNWRLFDNKRSGFNGDTSQLYPNLSNAEDSAGDQLELLSNGFKNRTVSGDQNGSGSNYIYMAFASSPFTTSSGIPTTAR